MFRLGTNPALYATSRQPSGNHPINQVPDYFTVIIPVATDKGLGYRLDGKLAGVPWAVDAKAWPKPSLTEPSLTLPAVTG